MYLTKRQKEVLTFIERYTASHGYAPTLIEIGEYLGVSSVATVHKHLVHLEQKGAIKRHWNHERAIEMKDGVKQVRSVEVPLLGRVAAGRPIEAVEHAETLALPETMLGHGDTYVLQVVGDSMIEEGIVEGDYIIVESREYAYDGEIVVALIGDEATVKRLYREGEYVRLQPANRNMKPLHFPAHAVRIRGIVIGLIRKFR